MGYSVLRPVSVYSSYDRVVDINGQLIKFQIKSIFGDMSGKTWAKKMFKKNDLSKYSSADTDYFALYIHDLKSWYFQKNSGRGSIFVSFSKLNNFHECLDLSP